MGIQINNLHKSYNDKKVLNNISLHVKDGSIFGLLGVNGAGKTTLVSILNFLEDFDSGSIHICNLDAKTKQKQIKQISSFVPQSFAFYPNLNAIENLEFFGALYGLKGKDLKQQIQKVLALTHLEKEAKTRAKKYSGGYKRRLNLAIGLLNEPKILYLDEPTTGVDAHTRSAMLKIIKDLKKELNTSIIYTSHYIEEIEYICNDIAILHKGEIILHESKESLLKKHKNLDYMFLNLTKEDIV